MSKQKRSTRTELSEKQLQAAAKGTLPVLYGDIAGVDIGSREHYVALPPDRGEPVRCFGCFTPELLRLIEYLKTHRIKKVVMESTGVFWVPLYELLEQRGFQVELTDARHLKKVSGRKSDVQDCEWLQRLASFGLLTAAFRPKPEITPLRAYWRQRDGLVKEGARQIQLMQKAMEQMNVQLHKAVDDITGLSGLRIMRAIVSGSRNPRELASLRHPSCKLSQDDFVAALTGTYRSEHIFALRQALEAYDFFQAQMERCDETIQAYMGPCQQSSDRGHDTAQEEAASKTTQEPAPFRPAVGADRISGIDLRESMASILDGKMVFTESDIDVDRFPTEKNFASCRRCLPTTARRVERSAPRTLANRPAGSPPLSAFQRNRCGDQRARKEPFCVVSLAAWKSQRRSPPRRES